MKTVSVPAKSSTVSALLGGLDANAFLRRYWHKEPLLVREAIADFAGPLGAQALFALAGRDDVEARLVVRRDSQWSLRHGPFRRADFQDLPERGWTLLVQGVNRVSREGDALLRRFAFVPYARLDDLMVSYAAPGGGVGPHFDSYDVFLLQGSGRRRWRYGRQDDLTLKPRLPLKILRRFTPGNSATLAPGDMLYLPPGHAHDGVALDACTTYSIGFRAPSANDLATAFLDFLRDEIDLPGRYTDPDLKYARAPAAIDSAMQRRHARMLKDLSWDRSTIARFVGQWLSEPKPNVVFEPPVKPLARSAFLRNARERGMRLDLRTQMLYDSTHIYINGFAIRWPPADRCTLHRLADGRALPAGGLEGVSAETLRLLYNWYRDGYVEIGFA